MIAELSTATARYEDVKKRSERLGDESRYLGAVLKPSRTLLCHDICTHWPRGCLASSMRQSGFATSRQP